MASESSSHYHPEGQPSSPSWLHARPLWAGLSIITMWLAVLFVGIFGGDILTTSPGGSSASIPVVVVLLPFVLPATIVVGRSGFAPEPTEQYDASSEDRSAREEPAARHSPGRPKLA